MESIERLEKYMKCEQVKNIDYEKFPRLTRVPRDTFCRMVHILKEAPSKKKARASKKNKLSIKNRLIVTHEYSREHRTYFDVRNSSGFS